jgi:hypothetical protein
VTQTIVKTFSDLPYGPFKDPVESQDLATKNYVDGKSVDGVVTSNLVGDGVTLIGASCTTGTKTVTVTGWHGFTADDVNKKVLLYNAANNDVCTFVGYIAAVNSDSSIDLDRNVTTTVSNVMLCYGTDETAVFQNDVDRAVAYALLHGGRVKLLVPAAKNDHFVVAGPLLHTRQGNSQVMLPVWATTSFAANLDIEGPSDGSMTQHWETTLPNTGGATFVSYYVYASAAAQLTDINANGHSSMIGGPTEPSGYTQAAKFNNVHVNLKNMQIRTTHSRAGIGIGAANLSSCKSGGVERFGWGTMSTVVQGIGSISAYGSGMVIGLYLPTAGNNDVSYMSNATCHGGYTYDVWVSEHTDFYSVRLLYGWAGLCIVGTYWSSVGTTHGVNGFLSIEACTYFIYFIGAGSGGTGPYLHLVLDTEGTLKIGDNSSGTASLAVTGKLFLMGDVNQATFTTDYPIGFDIVLMTKSYPNMAITANWTVDTFTELVVVDATMANVTVSLPTAVGRTKPITVVFSATASSHTCTIDPAGSETINGSATKVLTTQWDKARMEPFNGNWVQTA